MHKFNKSENICESKCLTAALMQALYYVCVCVFALNENTNCCPTVPSPAQTVIRLLIRCHAEKGVLPGLE